MLIKKEGQKLENLRKGSHNVFLKLFKNIKYNTYK